MQPRQRLGIAIGIALFAAGINVSRSEEVTNDLIQEPAMEPAPVVDVVVPPAQQPLSQVPVRGVLPVESPNTPSKAEMLRRQRIREELRNEDLLQTRLEELRLSDEKKREEQIQISAPKEQYVSPAPVVVAPPVRQSYLSQPAQPAAQPFQPSSIEEDHTHTVEKIVVSQAAPVAITSEDTKKKDESLSLGLFLRGGVNQMLSDEAYFKANGRYALGVGLDIPVADVLSLELGYQFSEMGVGLSSANPWYQGFQYANPGYNGTIETLTYAQNFFDALFKLSPLGTESRFRPYLGAGLGVSRGYLNYNRRTLDYLRGAGRGDLTADYETTSMVGSVAVGVDFKIGKQIMLGVSGKYSRVLAVTENYPFNYYAFVPWNGSGANPYTNYGPDSEKANAGAAFARSGFYSVLASLSFYF